MPSFYSDLASDPIYTALPYQVDQEELDRRVTLLRQGDMSQVKPICTNLMRFAMSLVANFANKKRANDLVGVALLELVECVNRAPTVMRDNNIMAYISSSISHRLKDFHQEDRATGIPGRTLRYRRSQGIEVVLPENVADSACANNYSEDHRERPHEPAIAKREEPSIEFMEIIHKIAETNIEKALIDLKKQRYTFEQISQQLQIGVADLHAAKRAMQARYTQLMGEDEADVIGTRTIHSNRHIMRKNVARLV